MDSIGTIRMGGQDRTFRKFPQRSKSFQLKPTNAITSMKRFTSRLNSTSTSSNHNRLQPNHKTQSNTQLILTKNDLIVQDSFGDLQSNDMTKSVQHDMFTLNLKDVMQPIRRYESMSDRASLNGIDQRTAHSATTLIINCSSMPPISPSPSSSSSSSSGYGEPLQHKVAMNSNSEEVTSQEDEGIITSCNDDDDDDDDDDFDSSEEYDDEDDEIEYHEYEGEDDVELENIVPCGSHQSFMGSQQSLLTRQVQLIRHPRMGLGLAIKGGSDYTMPVLVSSIVADSPADRCGSIYVGDRIISVNGVNIDETTCHLDALRLLSECGDPVCLVLRHSKATGVTRRQWRRRITFNNNLNGQRIKTATTTTTTLDRSKIRSNQIDYPLSSNNSLNTFVQRNDCANSNNNDNDMLSSRNRFMRIDLFLARISQYVTYSDKIRDSSFELQTSNDSSLVVQCNNDEIARRWFHSIKLTIDQLTQCFINQFNQYYTEKEHIEWMGWIDECQTIERDHCQHQPGGWRWLPRFMILKGGHVYLSRTAPISILKCYQHKLQSRTLNNNNKNNNNNRNSGTNSLGSVGSASTSSTSDTSQSSSLYIGKFDRTRIGHLNRSKTNRLIRLNNDLERDLTLNSIAYYSCYKTDFRCLKSNELNDQRVHCFTINNGIVGEKRYLSVETSVDLQTLNKAWTRSNYYSVMQLKNKTFTAVLNEPKVFGSLILDWKFGFTFYDPKSKQYLWNYKFYQLKHSSDDGGTSLSLTFVIDPNDSRRTRTHIIECNCLQTLIYTIHAFLSAKVFSLYL